MFSKECYKEHAGNYTENSACKTKKLPLMGPCTKFQAMLFFFLILQHRDNYGSNSDCVCFHLQNRSYSSLVNKLLMADTVYTRGSWSRIEIFRKKVKQSGSYQN